MLAFPCVSETTWNDMGNSHRATLFGETKSYKVIDIDSREHNAN